jgi:hypothetical protein
MSEAKNTLPIIRHRSEARCGADSNHAVVSS